MALQIYDYQSFKDYFSAIAASHVDIKGFVEGEMPEFEAWLKHHDDLPVLYLSPYNPIAMQQAWSDKQMGQIECALYLYAKAATEKYSDRNTTYKALEVIIRDILGKFIMDNTEGTVVTNMAGVKFGEVNLREGIVGANTFVGLRLDFAFFIPLRLIYNEAKWL